MLFFTYGNMQNKARLKMACSCNAFTRDYEEIRERLERDGAMADGLTYTIKIARELE